MIGFRRADRGQARGRARSEPRDAEPERARARGIPAIGRHEPDPVRREPGRVDGEAVDVGVRLEPPRRVDREEWSNGRSMRAATRSSVRRRGVGQDARWSPRLREVG